MDKEPLKKDMHDYRHGASLPVAKRPYIAPKLTAYGTLARLTRNGQGSGADGGSSMSMVCL